MIPSAGGDSATHFDLPTAVTHLQYLVESDTLGYIPPVGLPLPTDTHSFHYSLVPPVEIVEDTDTGSEGNETGSEGTETGSEGTETGSEGTGTGGEESSGPTDEGTEEPPSGRRKRNMC